MVELGQEGQKAGGRRSTEAPMWSPCLAPGKEGSGRAVGWALWQDGRRMGSAAGGQSGLELDGRARSVGPALGTA